MTIMPAVAPIIKHGNVPDELAPIDEPDILVNSLTITPNIEKQDFKQGRAITGLLFSNPTLTFAFDGYIKAIAGRIEPNRMTPKELLT